MRFPFFCCPYLRLDHFDGLIPFDFKTGPSDSNSKYLGENLVMWPVLIKHTSLFPPLLPVFVVFFAVSVLLSEPCVLGAHLLLQRSFVCCGGPEAGVGLWPHRHARACSNHQPRWAKARQTLRHSKQCPDCRCCCYLAVMLEFPTVWRWWLALGKTNWLHPASPAQSFHRCLWLCVQALACFWWSATVSWLLISPARVSRPSPPSASTDKLHL